MLLRRCRIFSFAGAQNLARGKTADSLRDGTVPGKSLRAGDGVSVSLDARLGAAAGIPGASGEYGGQRWLVIGYYRGEEVLNGLEGRDARDNDLL